MPSLPTLPTVASGLKIMYAGLCLIFLAILSLFLVPFVAPGMVLGNLLQFAEVIGYSILAGEILYIVGMLFCLATPGESGAKPMMIIAVVVATFGLAFQLLMLFAPEVLLKTLPANLILMILKGYFQLGLFTISTCLFLLGLKTLNRYINAERNAARANTSFFATLILVGLLVAMNLMVAERQAEFGRGNRIANDDGGASLGLGLGTLLYGLVWLIIYGNTLTYSARGMREHGERGGSSGNA